MLLSISLLLIFSLTSLGVTYTYINRNRLTSMIGMIVSMTISMMTSIAIGALFGVYLQDKDLALPTIISVSVGIVVGYITGRPISLIAALDGLTAGIMGGMMGAMLGVMLQPKSAEIMIYFIDFIYVLVNVLLLRVIDEGIKREQRDCI